MTRLSFEESKLCSIKSVHMYYTVLQSTIRIKVVVKDDKNNVFTVTLKVSLVKCSICMLSDF